MEKMIAFCGIACNECPTFQATQENNNEKRAKISVQWSKLLKTDLKPEDINCDGCQLKSGKLFTYAQSCGIRKCAVDKKVTNCAYCSDYPCEKLETLFKMVPGAKKRLDKIKNSL